MAAMLLFHIIKNTISTGLIFLEQVSTSNFRTLH